MGSLIHASGSGGGNPDGTPDGNPDGNPLLGAIFRDLAALHAEHMTYEMIEDAYAGEYHAFSWGLDAHACGGYASYGPSQLRNLHPELVRPAAGARFYIAGEAVSFCQGWVAGALDSAYDAVHRFLRLHGMEDAVRRLEENWGLGRDAPPVDF
ncbi:hypothetical protein E4U41_000232 [Claviceps citrina]|nr:hypothetical protein E4U41_000232 [Claviceps citrina]